MSYSALSFDELGSVSLPFDDGFIDMWAEVLQVRKDVLAAALADAFDEYLSHKLSSNRFEHWQQARDKFEQIHRSLSKTLFLWKSASPTERKAFDTLMVDRLPYDELQDQLCKMLWDVEEILEWGARSRGNQGRSRATGDLDVDLEPLQLFTGVIHDFWHKNVDGPFGIRTEENYESTGTDDLDAFVSEPQSRGIRFLHACLEMLEPGINAATCQTLMRKARAK